MIPTANDTKTFPVRKTKSKVKILLLSLEMGRHCDKVKNDYESTLSNCPVKSWLSKYTVSGTRRHNMMVALMLNRWSQGLERWLDIALSRPAQITSWPCYDCVWSCPSKHDGTNTVPHLYHFLPVCTGSTGYRCTVQKRYCFSIGFDYCPVPFIRYWTILFSYKHPIQRHNSTSVLVLPTKYIFSVKAKFCTYCQ